MNTWTTNCPKVKQKLFIFQFGEVSITRTIQAKAGWSSITDDRQFLQWIEEDGTRGCNVARFLLPISLWTSHSHVSSPCPNLHSSPGPSGWLLLLCFSVMMCGHLDLSPAQPLQTAVWSKSNSYRLSPENAWSLSKQHLSPPVLVLWKFMLLGFPGGSMLKNPSISAADMGSIPGLRISHMPRSN